MLFSVSSAPLLDKCPPGFIRGLEDSEVIVGKTIKLECQFFGIPEVDIQWYKDGGPIEDEERVVCDIVDDVTSLTLYNAEPDDQAWYRCKVYNDIGNASTECELVVVEPPKFIRKLENTAIDEGKPVFSYAERFMYSDRN